jgi:flagellin
MVASINNNLVARGVANNVAETIDKASLLASKMSTGERITFTYEDVAGFATGKAFKTQNEVFSTLATSAEQASLILSAADSGADSSLTIANRMKVIASLANQGNLSTGGRAKLDQEFQQLVTELDRVAQDTEYNGIKLLDGSLSGGNNVQLDLEGSSAANSGSITFATSGAADTSQFVINGVEFTFGTSNALVSGAINLDGQNAVTGAAKAQALADIINNLNSNAAHADMSQSDRDRLSELQATVSGATVTITSRKTGAAGAFSMNTGSIATPAAPTANGVAEMKGAQSITTASSIFTTSSITQSGSTTGGLGVSNVSLTGTLGNSLLTSVSSNAAGTSGWVTISSANLADDTTLNIFGTQFTLQNSVTTPDSQILRVGGASPTLADNYKTLQNIVTTLNNSNDPNIANFYYEAQLTTGGDLQIRATAKASDADVNGMNFAVGTAVGTITSGVSGGVDVSRITENAGFIGQISGFTAKSAGSNAAEVSVKVGDYVYKANISNTQPTSNLTVRFKSQDLSGKGGFFDLQLAANQGMAVNNDATAALYAQALDTAFNGLTFYQTREISTFKPEGTILEGTVASLTSSDFGSPNIKEVQVVNSQSDTNNQNAKINITMQDGRVFSNDSLGQTLHAGERIVLSNPQNASERIVMIFGKDINMSDNTEVSKLQSDLLASFGGNKGGLDFQVGLKADQSITVNISSLTVNELFDGKSLNLKTAASAKKAGEVLDGAIEKIISNRALIGSLQERIEYTKDYLLSAVVTTNAAAASFLNADLSELSTAVAENSAQTQASISVLVQANQISQNLLRLVNGQ